MEALPIVQEFNAAMKTKWVGVANLLKKSPPKLAYTHLGNISKSVKKGLYKIEGDIVSEQEFVAFLEWVRSEVDIAIPPTLHTPAAKPSILKMSPALEASPFTWRWWDLPIPWVGEHGQKNHVFPLPIAKLQEHNRVAGQECLVSATALWHLLPLQEPVGRFFASDKRTADRWDIWTTLLGVETREVRYPPKSSSAKKRSRPVESVVQADTSTDIVLHASACTDIVPHEPGAAPLTDIVPHEHDSDTDAQDEFLAVPKFSQYMVTPKVVLGSLMWMMNVQRASAKLQDAVYSILGSIVGAIVGYVDLPVASVMAGAVATIGIKKWLIDNNLMEAWQHKKLYKPYPDLAPPTIPAIDWFWFLFRTWGKSEAAMELAAAVVVKLAPMADAELARRSSPTLPPVKLPAACSECYQQVRKAMRGDDKVFLAYNAFLSRNTGFGAEDDHVLKHYVYDSKLACYQNYLLKSLVAAYFVKVRSIAHEALTASHGIVGDFWYWDASRVASKEVLLVHAWFANRFVSAPLQVLPDQASSHAPEKAMENVASVVLPMAKRQRTNRPKRRDGEATQSLLYALTQAIKVIFPVEGLDLWKPTHVAIGRPTLQRAYCRLNDHFYYWDKETRQSVWCIPPELRKQQQDSGECADVNVRVMVVVADEGSTGWSLYQWLASSQQLRIMWHRDPLHRLSNLFTNALKSTPGVLTTVFKHLLIHRWRRAPWGSGKFMKQMKETLDIFIRTCKPTHPIFEFMVEDIAKDHGVEGASVQQVWNIVTDFNSEAMGPKVQMRRWFTIWDAGWRVDKLWHTLLFALVMSYAMDGVDAFELAGKVVPVVQKGDSKQDQNFKFMQQVLVILMDQGNQRLLRSMLHMFRRVRMHQKEYTEACASPKACLQFHLFWSNESRWIQEMVTPALRDSLCSLDVMDRLNFKGMVSGVPSPLVVALDTDLDDAGVLLHHIRLSFDMVWQMLLYCTQTSSPPWSFCLLLDPDESVRKSCLQELRRIWEMVLKLESSSLPGERKWLQQLPLCKWVVFREPMLLLEAGSWDLGSAHGKLALVYVEALWSGNAHTLALENGFNDLRDNEGRGARHKARSEVVIQGLALSSMRARYAETTPLVDVEERDIAGQQQFHMRNELFQASRAPTTESELGMSAASIVDNKQSWSSTTPHLFSTNQLGLLRALMKAPSVKWDNLWMSALLRPHLVVSDPTSGQAFYVIGARPHSVALLKLKDISGDRKWAIDAVDSTIENYVPVVDINQFKCHDYSVGLDYQAAAAMVTIELNSREGESMVQFCSRTFLHKLRLAELKAVAAASGLAIPRMASHMTHVERIMQHSGGRRGVHRDRDGLVEGTIGEAIEEGHQGGSRERHTSRNRRRP